jgi:MFS family permease
MLAHVGFSYGEYVALISGAYVAKILFYPYVARFVKRVGTYRALWISGILVAPPPLFWFWTPQLYALITLQAFAGVAWAAFELASTLLVFDRIKADERIRILTYYNLFNALAVVVGALIGGAVLESLPADEAYHVIFAVSAAARLLSLGALFGMRTMTVKARRLVFRALTLRPSQGSMSQPILTSRDDKAS